MPTDKQHSDMESTNYELFGGDPRVVGYERETKNNTNEIEEVLGTMRLDTKSNELIAILNDQQE